MLPSRRLVRTAAEDDFVICQKKGKCIYVPILYLPILQPFIIVAASMISKRPNA